MAQAFIRDKNNNLLYTVESYGGEPAPYHLMRQRARLTAEQRCLFNPADPWSATMDTGEVLWAAQCPACGGALPVV